MKKYCTKCGKPFEAIGREVICPACKESAKAEAKREAVMRAKRASWNGESVPVRISGRASTFIREYGKEKKLPFSAALDELLKTSEYFKKLGIMWEGIVPYRSHRRDKRTTEDEQEVKATSTPQDKQDVPQEVKQEEVKQASKQAVKATSKPQAAKKAVKTVAGKTNKGGKA